MKERGILFSDAMVRAILGDRKHQTRRAIKIQPPKDCYSVYTPFQNEPNNWQGACTDDKIGWYGKCPYGVPGDRLIVRETWRRWDNGGRQIAYRADLRCYEACTNESDIWSVFDDGFSLTKDPGGWNPSSHMPRWASRITLEITDVRVQRLQEISEEDAWEEGFGVAFGPGMFSRAFDSYWDSINGSKHPWASNPWVWAITFAVTESAGRGKR
jgi:hypothetical protein